jgi:hypothetical protein
MFSKEELLEKVLSLASPICMSNECGIEYTFALDQENIRHYFETYVPKWRDEIRHYLISELRFGVTIKVGLYISEESGDLLVF